VEEVQVIFGWTPVDRVDINRRVCDIIALHFQGQVMPHVWVTPVVFTAGVDPAGQGLLCSLGAEVV